MSIAVLLEQLEVDAGQRKSLRYHAVDDVSGTPVYWPLHVVAGARPGKTLLITAGVHGDEYTGIVAINRFVEEVEPNQISGNLIMIPLVNPPAYAARTRANPEDGQDLARTFDGDPHGTTTERIAYQLSHEFIARADAYCDLHTSGTNLQIVSLCGYGTTAKRDVLEVQRAMGKAFGMPLVWGTPLLPGRSLTAAEQRQVPAIYTEIGGGGPLRDYEREGCLRGLHNVAKLLKILPGSPEIDGQQEVIEQTRDQAGFFQAQHASPVDGMFEPICKLGQRVGQGESLGRVLSPGGETLHEVEAPATGRVTMLFAVTHVHEGEPLAYVMEDEEKK